MSSASGSSVFSESSTIKEPIFSEDWPSEPVSESLLLVSEPHAGSSLSEVSSTLVLRVEMGEDLFGEDLFSRAFLYSSMVTLLRSLAVGFEGLGGGETVGKCL
jgi:hypothetical protein